MNNHLTSERLNIVLAGHVDHGKSTIVGRLLTDTDSLPLGKLEQIKQMCERTSRPFEYAFLVDALRSERAQGVTIDTARVFFKTPKREYLILDAPGHIEFVKNMVTGASRADAALLVIDAAEGVKENSRRHAYLISLLGIRQIAVLVNKMDLVDNDEQVYRRIVDEYSAFLSQLKMEASSFAPVSGARGDNIAHRSSSMPWYKGQTVLEILDSFRDEPDPVGRPFRMPVQDVYKFTRNSDMRRIIAGTVESGSVEVGDEIMFYPSGKKARVKSFESFNSEAPHRVSAGSVAGFTVNEQVFVTRGEVATKSTEARPQVTTRLKASVFWLGRQPFQKGKEYLVKLGTAKVKGKLDKIQKILDASTLELLNRTEEIGRYEVAECVLQLERAIAFDLSEEVPALGRFVIVDGYQIAGGGIIREALPDKQSWVREKVLVRDIKWEKSTIAPQERASRFLQRPTLILISGKRDSGKKPLAKALEARLIAEGHAAYFLGIGNILYGVDADIKGKSEERHEEHIRRLAEVAHIILDAGFILIVTAIELTPEELEIIQTTIQPDQMVTIWKGEGEADDGAWQLRAPAGVGRLESSVEDVIQHLRRNNVIYGSSDFRMGNS